MKKSCREKEGHSTSRVNLGKRLYEKKVTLTFANSGGRCSDCYALIELTRLCGQKCLNGEKLARQGE